MVVYLYKRERIIWNNSFVQLTQNNTKLYVVIITLTSSVMVITYKNKRQTIQKASFAISLIVFAMATYGIFTQNDDLFIIGLIFIGFVVLGGILLAPILGRFWFGWLCPRGIFLDYVVGRLTLNKKIPRIFRTKGFKTFMVGIMILMLVMAISGMNPFLQSTNPLASLGGFLVLMCIVTTAIIAIPLGIIYKPRIWCSFCPMGYIQSLISNKRMLKLQVNECVDCNKCEKACPMELHVKNDDTDCFNCMQCVDVCKKQAVTPTISLE